MESTANYSIIQGSKEWYEIRRGKFTSSEIYRLMSDPKDSTAKKNGELSDGAKTYVLEKVHETLTGELESSFDSVATVWGVQNEPLARTWYEKLTGLEVKEVGFTTVSDSFGGSADGLVGEDGGIEIKAPYKGSNHLDYSLIESQEYMKKCFKEHYWQCVSNAFINNRKWWDFVSFDPRLNYDSGFFRFRINPSLEEFDLISKKVAQATELKLQLIEKFTAAK